MAYRRRHNSAIVEQCARIVQRPQPKKKSRMPFPLFSPAFSIECSEQKHARRAAAQSPPKPLVTTLRGAPGTALFLATFGMRRAHLNDAGMACETRRECMQGQEQVLRRENEGTAHSDAGFPRAQETTSKNNFRKNVAMRIFRGEAP